MKSQLSLFTAEEMSQFTKEEMEQLKEFDVIDPIEVSEDPQDMIQDFINLGYSEKDATIAAGNVIEFDQNS